MEPIKQNQSVDGFRPIDGVSGSGPTPPNSPAGGFSGGPRPGTGDLNTAGRAPGDVSAQPNPVQHPVQGDVDDVAKLRKKNKSLKIWLAILSLLFVAGITAAVVSYMQTSKSQADLDKKNQEIATLEQEAKEQQASATQQQIDQLKTENADLKQQNAELQKQVTELQTYITTLYKAASDLKTKCASSCSNITVPAKPASATATTTQTTP